jgi:hypothetical protein
MGEGRGPDVPPTNLGSGSGAGVGDREMSNTWIPAYAGMTECGDRESDKTSGN